MRKMCRVVMGAAPIALWSFAVSSQAAPPNLPTSDAFDVEDVMVVKGVNGVNFPESYVADEFIVVLKADVRSTIGVSSDRNGAPVVSHRSLQSVLTQNGVTRFERQFADAQPELAGSVFHDLTGYYTVKIAPGFQLERAMTAFGRHPSVDHVEAIGVHPIYATPNDTYYMNPPATFPYPQWHYWDTFGVDADLAWNTVTGNASVVVGVLDTGVKYFHTDLGGPNAQWGPGNPQTNGNIWVNGGEIPGNGVDDDANGRIDDTIGFDFVSSSSAAGCKCLDVDCSTADNNPNDGEGHGTHVAGTVAAITNNARAVAGVAGGFSDGTTSGAGNGSKVMALRIGWRARCSGVVGGVVRMDYAAAAMDYVRTQKNRGVNVAAINCSWGSSNSGGISAAADNLLAADVMIIVAAGNSNSSTAPFLNSKVGTLSVGATDRNGAAASFTNFGSWVDIAAPGVDIVSTYHDPTDTDPTHMYVGLLSGTSMSAPHCCGVAALLESKNPALTGPQKYSLMQSTATPYSGTKYIGTGIVNANNAVGAAGP